MMENFIVSARKYRPITFQTVVGQQHITGTLKNAIKNNQLAQGFLFCGPRGVGKTTCARILAKTINCTNLSPQTEACGTCESCLSFQSGHSFNFHELDAASNNSVEDIRHLIEQVRIPPQAGKFKAYIIDEVHMLSSSAFNAFLKTLEEPPSYVVFILATTEKHKILPTILSRCQIFDFNRIKTEDISAHLAEISVREAISFDNDALHIIAQKADGGLRDALSVFDQIVSYTNKQVTYQATIKILNILDYDYYFRLTDYLINGNLSASLLLFNEVLNNGFDGNHFINGLAAHFRNLLVSKDWQTIQLLEASETVKQKYLSQSKTVDLGFMLTALNLTNQCDLNYKLSKNQRLQVELTLIKICHIPSVLQLAQLSGNDENQIKKTLVDTLRIETASTQTSEKQEDNQKKSAQPNQASLPFDNNQDFLSDKAEPKKNTIITKPAPGSQLTKIEINPSNKPASLIPSLTDLEKIANEPENKSPKYINGTEREPFSFDELMNEWKLYAQKARKRDKIQLYTLLTTNAPELNGTEITVLVENFVLESALNEEKIDLLNFLRANLRNFDIELKTKRIEATQKKRIYTNKDKYVYMAEKNQTLDEFRKRFNLDINP